MSDRRSGSRLTRRRLLGSAAAIGAAAAGTGAGTYAYLQDTERSTNNTIAMGTLDLVVSDTDEGFGDGVSGTWAMSGMRPGDTLQGDVSLQNDGSIDAEYVDLSFDYEEEETTDPDGSDGADTLDGADGMAKQFEVLDLDYDFDDVLAELEDVNENGYVDVDDLAADENADALSGLTAPPASNGGTTSLFLELEFVDGPDNNDYQGDTLDLTVTMKLQQEAG